jgi:hypothetical protein
VSSGYLHQLLHLQPSWKPNARINLLGCFSYILWVVVSSAVVQSSFFCCAVFHTIWTYTPWLYKLLGDLLTFARCIFLFNSFIRNPTNKRYIKTSYITLSATKMAYLPYWPGGKRTELATVDGLIASQPPPPPHLNIQASLHKRCSKWADTCNVIVLWNVSTGILKPPSQHPINAYYYRPVSHSWVEPVITKLAAEFLDISALHTTQQVFAADNNYIVGALPSDLLWLVLITTIPDPTLSLQS